ncbi:hypothetical protein DM01DRAFT_1409488 [Hesseltinella vesiculosa]|uniref:Uncharacterized protein n=1 Tax=Hesseltinella vesiculosa TaxID=101127 RepID=A0A1X2GB30_9FUNG|nr:hypothetical protein DM01DRAFT_1409488 [Hesseltinella vesiculosa]
MSDSQQSISLSEIPRKRRRRSFPSDAQWCVDNKDRLTCKRFVEHHGILVKTKALQRYHNIIKRYLPDMSGQLKSELKSWKQTADWSEFWMKKQIQLARLETRQSCLNFSQTVLRVETSALTGEDEVASNNEQSDGSGTSSPTTPPNASPIVSTCSPWIVSGMDVAKLFAKYKGQSIEHGDSTPLDIGCSLHDILSVTGILLLSRNQHGKRLSSVFGNDNLDKLTDTLLSSTLDTALDWQDCEFLKLARIVNTLSKDVKNLDCVKRDTAMDTAELQLHQLSSELPLLKKAIVKGIISMIAKLPMDDLKDENTLGENELTGTFFDPIFSRIIANPLNKVHLRWSDTMAPETPKRRPDAIISQINQLAYGSSLGFGEAKIQNASKYDLCHDLLRLALFSKECIDMNSLDGCFLFQIHGFGVTFYITQLLHQQIYTMVEIGHLVFPRSINELPTFVNLSTLNTLLHVSDAFWRLCRPARDPSTISSRMIPTHPTLYELISSSKCSSADCTIRFEK